MFQSLSLLVGITLLPTLAKVYDDDTHYDLTYCIALSCGYTSEQARRIASANLMIDYCNSTEPIHFEITFENRIRFHSLAESDEANRNQLANLFKDSVALLNPGIYLHAYQDYFSHFGYGPRLGHWSPFVSPSGTITDYNSYKQSRDLEMALGTMRELQGYMLYIQSRQRPTPESQCRTEVMGLLDVLQRANPAPKGDFSSVRPNFARARKMLLNEKKIKIGKIIQYGLKPSSETLGAVPFGPLKKYFPIWLSGTCGIDFKENLAGIRPGRVYMDIKLLDGEETGRGTYIPFIKESTEDSVPLDLGLIPVGKVKVHYKANGLNLERSFDQTDEDGQSKPMLTPVYFNSFKMGLKSGKNIQHANIEITSLNVQSDIRNFFPKGNLVSSIRIRENDNKSRTLTFGPFLGRNDCIFQSLGWDGFNASECWVEDNRGSKLRGSYSVSIKPNGSGIISFRAVGKDAKGKAISFAGSGIKFGKDDLASSTIPDYTRG